MTKRSSDEGKSESPNEHRLRSVSSSSVVLQNQAISSARLISPLGKPKRAGRRATLEAAAKLTKRRKLALHRVDTATAPWILIVDDAH
jgi:hypothetical protein